MSLVLTPPASLADLVHRSRKGIVGRSLVAANSESRDLLNALGDLKGFAAERDLQVKAEDASSQASQPHDNTSLILAASIALDTFSGAAKTAAELCADWLADAKAKAQVDEKVGLLNRCCAPIVRPGAYGIAPESVNLDESLAQASTLSVQINQDLLSLKEQLDRATERNRDGQDQTQESTSPDRLSHVSREALA